MVEDILKFYPLNTKNFSTGLFATPLKNRPWSDRPKKSLHGISYTQFEDAFEIKVTESLNLFDLFHGFCDDFAMYFKKLNPDWEIYALKRDSFNPLIHMYAIKHLEDGRILFADARGVTDNVLDFFRDFRFAKSAFVEKVELVNDIPLENACKVGYEKIYKT